MSWIALPQPPARTDAPTPQYRTCPLRRPAEAVTGYVSLRYAPREPSWSRILDPSTSRPTGEIIPGHA